MSNFWAVGGCSPVGSMLHIAEAALLGSTYRTGTPAPLPPQLYTENKQHSPHPWRPPPPQHSGPRNGEARRDGEAQSPQPQ